MNQFILSPPVAILLLLSAVGGLTYLASFLAAPSKENQRKGESYACGQRNVTHLVNPDYNEFFPFAFFFTVVHVLVLVVATAPSGALALPLLYVAVGVLALVIVFRG